MVTDLPKYSTDVLKFNIATTGTLTALPYLAMWISSFIFGFVCDIFIKKGWHSIKTGRIIHTTIGNIFYLFNFLLYVLTNLHIRVLYEYTVVSFG